MMTKPFFMFLCFYVFMFLGGSFAHGAHFEEVLPAMSFGRILIGPYENTITIDAQNGSDIPRSTEGLNKVTGGNSGLIRYRPDMAGQQVHLVFPDKVVLDSDGKIFITGMRLMSTRFLTVRDTKDYFLHIGGILNLLPRASSGNYARTITINISLINP